MSSDDITSETVPQLILAQARRSPAAPALESGADCLTYAQVVALATGLASHLRGHGVRPGDLVAVALPRCVDIVPTLLGVQLAGAAYLPLDPEHPTDRLNHILADSGARVVVTADAAGTPGLRAGLRVHLSDVAVPADPRPPAAPDPDTAAYVIYTSGSTGTPKGVQVTHRALANFIASMRERPGLPDDVVLPAVTTFSFDIAALELFLPLTTGGRVVVARQDEATDPYQLRQLLARTGARVMQATPITWRLLLEAGWTPPERFTVLCGGERLPAALADRLLGDTVVLWDLYGPTETTVWSAVTRYELGAATEFQAVRGTSLHLLDEKMEPVVTGELYIGGAGLAVGYRGRPALSAERFVADPFGAPGDRLYRTGDVARRHPGGRVEILGRSDDQLKIRGFRIEPGEIESVLAGYPGVADAAVRAIGDDEDAVRLVGYLRPADPADPPDLKRLLVHLTRSLPAYMVPAQIVVLNSFPTTHNGKLDRAALPAPPAPAAPGDAAGETAGASAGDTAQRVAEVLAEVLERPEMGPHDDFFALGGDSLRAVQAILRLNAEMDTQVPINALFEARTVYGLAQLLDGGDEAEPRLVALDAERAPRMSSAQWRLWLHQLSAPQSTADNEPMAVRLPGPLDSAALDAALTGLFARHDILRTRYEFDDSGQPVPVVQALSPVRLEAEDTDPQAVLAAELSRPFDLAKEAPVRLRLVHRAGADHCLLLMVVHRIGADHRSRELIASQVRAGYRGRSVPTPPLRYADYAEWRRQVAAAPAARRHLDFWQSTLAGLVPAALPTDRPRTARRDGLSGTVRFTVPADVMQTLEALTAEHETTRFMALLTSFFAVLARYTSGTDLTVGVPVPGRDRPELQELVGTFEETAVVRVDAGGRPAFAELLSRVRTAMLAAHDHAAVPFEDIVAAVPEPEPGGHEPGRNPLFDVQFSMHGVAAEPAGLTLPDPAGVKLDLSCHLTERLDGGLDGRLDYATQLFDEATVARLASSYLRMLGEAGAAPDCPLDHLAALDRA
jgi:amino acid adenylation domain-containing protein